MHAPQQGHWQVRAFSKVLPGTVRPLMDLHCLKSKGLTSSSTLPLGMLSTHLFSHTFLTSHNTSQRLRRSLCTQNP